MSRRVVTLRPGVELVQEEPWFPLGQDTLLLARFAAERARGRGLDLGCGQGFLAILTALRRPGLYIEGLERFPEPAALAAENARRAGLALPVTLGNAEALPVDLHGRFDFVLCNPPYFRPGTGKTAPNPARAAARTGTESGLGAFLRGAFLALKTGGKLFVCFPAGEGASLFSALEQNRLALKRLRPVYPGPDKPAYLLLAEAVKDGGAGMTLLPPLFLRDGAGQYTREYREICEESS